MTTEIDKRNKDGDSVAVLEKVIIEGDLEQLSPAERIDYYRRVCESLDLNPLTRSFEYIKLQGRMTLYAKKDATEQLAAQHNISISINDTQSLDGVYVVRVRASQEGRHADATGAVPIEGLKGEAEGLKGEAKANALMKAETKASRRAVLRLVGLGWLDETELETIADKSAVTVHHDTGEIAEQPSLPRPKESRKARKSSGDAVEPGSWAALREYVLKFGWAWPIFESQVLGASQADFECSGGTPAIAWKRYLRYSHEQELGKETPDAADTSSHAASV